MVLSDQIDVSHFYKLAEWYIFQHAPCGSPHQWLQVLLYARGAIEGVQNVRPNLSFPASILCLSSPARLYHTFPEHRLMERLRQLPSVAFDEKYVPIVNFPVGEKLLTDLT